MSSPPLFSLPATSTASYSPSALSVFASHNGQTCSHPDVAVKRFRQQLDVQNDGNHQLLQPLHNDLCLSKRDRQQNMQDSIGDIQDAVSYFCHLKLPFA